MDASPDLRVLPPVTIAAARIESFDRWLRVHFDNAHHADFHYVWLRHNCDHDRHPQTGERTLDPSDIDPDIAPASVRIDAGTASIEIAWKGAASAPPSRYSLAWLSTHAYASRRREVSPPPSNVDRVTIDGRLFSDPTTLARVVVESARAHGVAIVRGFLPNGAADPADTETLVTAFAANRLAVIGTHFGRIEDLRTDNTTNANTDQLGYTDAAIQLHTDQPFLAEPPQFQLLHAMRAATHGGDNAIVDAAAAARYLESLDTEAFDLLRTEPVHFHRKQKAFERLEIAPILAYSADGAFRVRYSYFTMAPFSRPFASMESWYRAYRRFAAIVRAPEHQYRFRLEAGDFVLYDNHRMLHARTGFSGPRWVRGVYFDSLSDSGTAR